MYCANYLQYLPQMGNCLQQLLVISAPAGAKRVQHTFCMYNCIDLLVFDENKTYSNSNYLCCSYGKINRIKRLYPKIQNSSPIVSLRNQKSHKILLHALSLYKYGSRQIVRASSRYVHLKLCAFHTFSKVNTTDTWSSQTGTVIDNYHIYLNQNKIETPFQKM